MRTLKKNIWPYSVRISFDSSNSLIDLDKWCANTIGKRFQDWYSYRHGEKTRTYAFKDESTLLIFKITWGHYGTW